MNTELVANNFVRIPNFVGADYASRMAHEFKEFGLNNRIGGDRLAPDSISAYCYMPFIKLLMAKLPKVTSVVEETLLPTYAYSRVYKKGSVLNKHLDREACEISLSVHLSGDAEWPIYFQRPDKSDAEVRLGVGDAVLYLGCDTPHWRNEFSGQEYTQVFLHYVRADGPNSWAYFDKRLA